MNFQSQFLLRVYYIARKLPITTQKYLLVSEFKLVQLSRLPPEPGKIDYKWNNMIQRGKYSNLSEVVIIFSPLHKGLSVLSRVFPFQGKFSAKKELQ